MSRNDSSTDDLFAPSDEELDHTPLTFGMWKGKTPNEVSQAGKKAEQYLVWAYENVAKFPVCSKVLYEDCGSVGERAGSDVSSFEQRSKERIADARAKQQVVKFDDTDDDIPF